MKKVIILIGSYCSGKTEIAINMAIRAAGEGKRTLVVDLDRINDYFRMSDQIPVLTDKRVNIVSPTFVGKGVTQTNMPAAVASAFDQDWDLVVFDVGGDQAGALSLARYHQDFAALPEGSLEVYDIVNVFRPAAETPEKILKLKGELEDFARQAGLCQQLQSAQLRERRRPAPWLRGAARDLGYVRHTGRAHRRTKKVPGGVFGRRPRREVHWYTAGAGDIYAPKPGHVYIRENLKAQNTKPPAL